MRKITFLCVFISMCYAWQSHSQVLDESFNATTLPSGWTQEYVSGTEDWAAVTTNGNSTISPRTGSHMAEFRTTNQGDITKLVSPSMDLTILASPQLTFYYANVNWIGDIDELRVYYKTSAAGSWIQIGADYTAEQTSWTKVELLLPNPSNDYFIAFEATSNWARGLNLDDVMVAEAPTCLAPSAMTATNILDTTVDLGWTETGTATTWDIEVVDAGTVPVGTPTDAGVTTNPYTKTGLTANTDYEFYVRADCGSGDLSQWAGPYAFSTACGSATVPYTMDFESLTPPDLPNCSTLETLSGNNWDTYNVNANGFNGNVLRYAYNSSQNADTWYYTQGVDLTGGISYQLIFSYGNNSTTYTESLKVAYGTSPASGDMTTILGDYPTINTGIRNDVILHFTPTTTDTYYFGFNCYSGSNQYYLYLDDISLMLSPPCLTPSALTASNILGTTADLGWTETGTATTWDIEVVDAGTTPLGTPTDAGVTTNPFTKTGLTVTTDYEFYVRADCGSGDLSQWAGPYAFQTTCAAQLSGVYTIGATGDYPSLNAAVTALTTCGVSGPVTFDLLPGSGPYQEQIVLGEITGASATNTITFNGNGEILTSATTTNSRSLFLLDGADYVTIKNFNLVTISDTNNFVIQLTNNADHNEITNNTIDMSSTLTSTSTSNAGILVSGSLTSATSTTGSSGTDNVISGNTITGGYYGINVNGQSATRSMDNIIEDNILEDFYGYGISLRYNNNSLVANNEISRPTRASVTTFYGIYLASGGEGNLISGNNIHTPFGGITTSSTNANYGIYHTSNDSPLGNESKVINNIVHLRGNDGTIYALYNSGSDGVHYYHNTVVLDDETSTDGITRGFYQTTSASNIEVKNNVISILRTGSDAKYCLYFNTSGSSIVSDHNVLYMGSTDGTTGIGYSGSAQVTLTDWQTATSGDANSLDADPLFTNRLASDFKPTNSVVNNIGTPVSVTTDFNGDPRSATTPDPGAYEFTPPSCIPPSALEATSIMATSADLGWTENGAATTWDIEVVTAGTSPTGTPTDAGVTTNPFNKTGLTALTDYDFYVRANCGSGDESTWVGPFTFKTDCPGPLAGTYTVGATGDFATLSDVAYALNTCGVSATTTFNALPGSGPYEEQIVLGEITGASSTNTIAINGNGETLTAMTVSSNRSLILLDGTDYTTIVNFNLVTISDTNNFVIQLTNNADHNVITNNTIDMSSTLTSTSTSNAGILVSGSLTTATSTTGSSGTDNVIAGNTITGGYYGININGQSATPSLSNIITNNTLEDFYGYGISLRYNNNSVVANNEISRPSRDSVTTFYGIYLASGGEGNIISGNNIHTPFGGITTSSTSANYGIYHASNDSPLGNESKVINNIVHLSGNNGTIYALYNSNSDGVHYYHNTVVLDDPASTSGTTRGFYQTGSASNIELKNNVISILRTGSGAKYCLYFNTSGSSIVSDHNVLFMGATDGTTGIGYSGGAQSTLTDWQTATSGDANSVDVNPLFVNPLGGDFSPTNPAVNDIGTSVGVTTDFSGDPRSATTPDPGAYEFTPPSCILPSGLYATNILSTSADLGWTENGTATTWDIEVVTAGTSPTGTPTDVGVTTNPFNKTGLTAQTAYEFYVRADCGSGDLSSWSGPFAFLTKCAAVAAPWSDDVEGHTATTTLTDSNCWSTIPDNNESGDYDWNIAQSGSTPSSNTGPSGANSGTNYFYVEASNSSGGVAELYTPLVDISALTVPSLQFYYHMYGQTMGDLHVDIFDGTAWVNDVFVLTGEQQTADTDPWLKAIVDLSTYTGTIQVRFRAIRSTDYYGDISLDDIEIKEAPSCFPPTFLTATNIFATSADLGWTEGGTATSWDVHVVLAGDPAPSSTTTPTDPGVTSSPYNKTGLTAETAYEFYVRADCGTEGSSSWAGPYGFTTPCAAVVAPWTDDVEAHTPTTSLTDSNCWTTIPDNNGSGDYDWNIDGSGSTPSLNTGPSGANSGSNYFYVEATNSTGGVAELYTPFVDISTLTVPALEFYYHMYGGDMGDLHVDIFDGTAWVNNVFVLIGEQQTAETDPWLLAVVDLSPYSGIIQARFRAVRGPNFEGDISLDDISFKEGPLCFDPTSLTATNILATSADLGWTQGGTATTWDIEVVTAGTTPTGTPTDAGVTTNPFNKTGLTAQTAYEFYVRADCGTNGMSSWAGPYAFTTPCVSITAPHSENFDAVTAPALPNCWSTYPSTAMGSDVLTVTSTDDGSTIPSAPNAVEINDIGTPTLITPPFSDLPTGQYQVTVSLSYEDGPGTAWTDELLVGVMSDPNDFNTFVPIHTVTTSSITVAGFSTFTFVFSDTSLIGNSTYIAFHNTGGSGGYEFYLDDFVYELQPSCLAPTNLAASALASTSADLSWTDGNTPTATLWDVHVVFAGDPAPTSTTTPTNPGVTTNPYNVTGLSAQTAYDFYVRTDCGGGDSSDWAGPFSFTTTCASVTAPWSEDFENGGSIPSCWEQGPANSKDWQFANTPGSNHIGDNGTMAGSTTSGGYFAWVDDSQPGATGTTLLSPYIDVSGLNIPELSFYRISHNEGNSNVDFSVDVWDGAAWNDDMYFTNTNSMNGAWEKVVVNIGALNITGDIRIRFVIDENNGTDFYDDVAIDDVSVYEQPTCPQPSDLTATNITTNSADLGWTEAGTATTWDIEIVPTGTTPTGTPTDSGVTTNPYTITGLSACSSYEFYVRADCGGGDLSFWSGPYTLNTLPGTVTAPWSEAFENAGSIPNCWEQGAANSKDWEFANTPGSNHIGDNGTINGNTDSDGYFAWVDDSEPGATGTTLLSPFIDVTGLFSPELSFYRISHNEGNSNVDFSVDVWDGAAWNDDVYFSNTNSLNGGWEKIIVDLTTLNITGDIRIRFVIDENNGTDFYDDVAIDDVSVHERPCIEPSDISISNILINSAEVSWTENGGAMEWEIEYGITGFTQGTGTVIQDTDGTLGETISGLSSATVYDVYVRALCSIGNNSPWGGPVSFTTACSAIDTFPYQESFEDNSNYRTCWFNEYVSSDEEWEYVGSNQNGTVTPRTGALMAEFSTTNPQGDVTKLVSPALDLTNVSNPTVEFYYANVNWNGDVDELRVYYRTSGTDPWIQIGADYTTENTSWTFVSLNLPNPSSEYYIAFEGTSNYGRGLDIDDVWIGPGLGVKDVVFNDFVYYPNPASNQLFMEANNNIEQVVVYNLLGQEVINIQPNQLTPVMDVSALQSGAYLMKVRIAGSEAIFRILKE